MKTIRHFFLYGISKSLLLKIIIFLIILLIGKNVFAAEFNMNNYTSATLNGTKNRYQGTEIYEVGGNFTYQFGTRYQGRLSEIETYFDYPFEANTTYRFTYNMATNDFNNNFGNSYWWDCDHTMTNQNAHVFIPTYISYKKIQYSITPDDDTSCIRVSVRGKNLSTGNITQISNWALSSITIYDPDFQSGSSGSQGTSPAPTPNPNEDIINNQNNNTQDIINNNNQNTEDIISSIQETTESVNNTIIETFGNKCSNILNVKDVADKSDGISILVKNDILELKSNNSWAHVVYDIPIEKGKTYYFKGELLSLYANYVVIALSYTGPDGSTIVNDRFWSYEPWQAIPDTQTGSWSTTFSTDTYDHVYLGVWVNKENGGNTAQYIRMTLNDDNASWCAFNSFTSKIDETTDAINNVNNSINNDNVDSGVGSNFFNDFSTSDNGGISAIVTKPLMIINNLLSNNGQCANLTLPEFMGVSTAYLPSGCILWNNASSTMINLWNIFVCGLGSYFILKDIFRIIENLKNPDNDKVEVMDL